LLKERASRDQRRLAGSDDALDFTLQGLIVVIEHAYRHDATPQCVGKAWQVKLAGACLSVYSRHDSPRATLTHSLPVCVQGCQKHHLQQSHRCNHGSESWCQGLIECRQVKKQQLISSTVSPYKLSVYYIIMSAVMEFCISAPVPCWGRERTRERWPTPTGVLISVILHHVIW